MRIRNASSWTILIFGLIALALGAVGILSPETQLAQVGFEVVDPASRPPTDYTRVFVIASSMASFNVGAYYILAAFNNLKKFYAWTVPFRMVTVTVFTLAVINGIAPQSFLLVAAFELVGAVATGIALLSERGAST